MSWGNRLYSGAVTVESVGEPLQKSEMMAETILTSGGYCGWTIDFNMSQQELTDFLWPHCHLITTGSASIYLILEDLSRF